MQCELRKGSYTVFVPPFTAQWGQNLPGFAVCCKLWLALKLDIMHRSWAPYVLSPTLSETALMPCNPAHQGPPLSEVLRRIELHRVYDVHEVAAALDAIAARWTLDSANPAVMGNGNQHRAAQPAAPDNNRPGLIIVDSVSAAIAPVYGRPLHGNEGVSMLLTHDRDMAPVACAQTAPVAVPQTR